MEEKGASYTPKVKMSGFAGSRKIVIGVIVAAVCVVAMLAAIVALVFVSDSSNGLTSGSNGETDVSEMNIDDSREHASELYNNAVSDINDTTAVVNLLDAMKFEEAAGEYSAVISEEDGVQVLFLDISEQINEDDQKTFNSNMEIYAQQMLALIPGVGKIQWTYSVKSDDASEEKSVVSLDEKGASDILGNDVRSYGKSVKSVKKLLSLQKNAE